MKDTVDHHIGVDLSTIKIIEEGCSMIKIIGVVSGEEILGECKITEVKILEEDIEVASEMIILEEIEVGLEKDSLPITLGGMIEAVVGQDHILEQIPIGIELDVSSIGSMIILLKIVQIYQR